MHTKFVLVYWTEEASYSILSADFVPDKRMLIDPELHGMVKFPSTGKKEPKTGWRVFPAKVVATGGT
jgi:hypothetical protein